MPSVDVFSSLVLDSNLGEMADDVLHLGVSLASLGTAEVVEPLDVVEEIVNDGNNDGDTD